MKRDELNHNAESWTCFLCTANHDVDQHADLDEQITNDAKGMKSVNPPHPTVECGSHQI